MDHLPVFLDVKDRTILVDGGGTAAARRAERALSVGARVCLYDPTPGSEVLALIGATGFTHIPRCPEASDFTGVTIAYGASDDPVRDRLLRREGKRAGALVNVADVKHFCDFITPSIVDRGAVSIAISTGGTAPVIGRILRARIEAMLPGNYGKLARFLSKFRREIESKIPDGRARRRYWEKLIEGPIADRFLDGDETCAETMIQQDLERPEQEGRGDVTLVGIGCGEADLVTFRAIHAMQRADLVLHDPNTPTEIIGLVRRDAKRVEVSDVAVQVAVAAQARGERVVWIVSEKMAKQGELETCITHLKAANADARWIPGVGVPGADNAFGLPIYSKAKKHELGLAPHLSQ